MQNAGIVGSSGYVTAKSAYADSCLSPSARMWVWWVGWKIISTQRRVVDEYLLYSSLLL